MTTTPMLDAALQAALLRAIGEYTPLAQKFSEMITVEEKELATHAYPGAGVQWQAEDVHCDTRLIQKLIGQGFIDQVYRSNNTRTFRLHDRETTRAALAVWADDEAPPPVADAAAESVPLNLPDDLFSVVIGHDDAKTLLRYAVTAERPAHVLLFGPPSSGKTLLLDELRRMPNTHRYSGVGITRAGLRDFLLGYKPRILLISELDKMAQSDTDPLLDLMEEGTVYRLQHGRTDQVAMQTWVFADANDPNRVSRALWSRFLRKEIQPYTREEFIRVSMGVLQYREGLGPAVAEMITMGVVPHSLDIRDVRQIANMARRKQGGRSVVVPSVVREIIAAYWPAQPRAAQQTPQEERMPDARRDRRRGA